MKYKLFSLAILAGFLFVSSNSFAYDDDEIVYIPDPHFKKMLVNYHTYDLETAVIDLNEDGEIQYSEAEAFDGWFKMFYVSDSVSNFDGIKAFNNIIRISLSSCKGITEIDFSGMTGLREIYVDENPNLTKIDVSNCTNLRSLRISENKLNQLSFENCTKLSSIWCNTNYLDKIDAKNCPQLLNLFIRNNSISNISVTVPEKIEKLYTTQNELVNLDVSQMLNLKGLKVSNNKLTTLNVNNANNKNITIFETINNQDLECITVDDTSWSNEHWTEIDEWTKFSEDCTNSIKESNTNRFKIFPNPAIHSITIKRVGINTADLRIIDIKGNICLSHTIPYKQILTKLDISKLTVGTYIIENEIDLLIIE